MTYCETTKAKAFWLGWLRKQIIQRLKFANTKAVPHTAKRQRIERVEWIVSRVLVKRDGIVRVSEGELGYSSYCSIEPHRTYLICRYWYLRHATDIVIRNSGVTLKASTSEPFRTKRTIIDGWTIIDRRTIIDRWAVGRWRENWCGWAPMKWVHTVWSPKIEALFSNYEKEK